MINSRSIIMAFSSSVKRSQNILVCGLCDVNTKVKVKCMDCDLYLCDNCEERHSRFKHADSHSILAIRDIHLHKDKEEEFKPVKCKNHKKQFYSIFCRTCDHLICPICNVETHQKHDLEKIEIMCKRKCEELEDFENDAKTDIKTQKYLQELHFQSKCCEIKRILEAKIKAIQELNSRYAKELREIKDLEMQFAQDTPEIKYRISHEQEIILNEKEEIELLLESKNIEIFLEAANNLKTRLKTFHGTMKSNKQRITPLQSISGDYTSAVLTFTNNNIKFTRLGSFPMESLSVTSITSNQMNSVWIADANGENIQHLELSKDIKIVETHQLPEGEINEIRCFNENEILLTSSNKIFLMTADGKFGIFKDFTPTKVYTLHVTTNGDIVVGMDNEHMDKKQDKIVIVILRNDGKTKFEYRNSGNQLLQNDFVRCCTVLEGDVICYIDSVNEFPYNGRLVVLDKSGYIQWTYNGYSTINTEYHPFTPVEVISTKNNNIITSDTNQNAIHILTSTGFLLTILDLSLLGIKIPGVMALVSDQFLWMEGRDNDYNSVLFKLKISGI